MYLVSAHHYNVTQLQYSACSINRFACAPLSTVGLVKTKMQDPVKQGALQGADTYIHRGSTNEWDEILTAVASTEMWSYIASCDSFDRSSGVPWGIGNCTQPTGIADKRGTHLEGSRGTTFSGRRRLSSTMHYAASKLQLQLPERCQTGPIACLQRISVKL